MNVFYCGASAVGKRYAPESGTPLVNHLLESAARSQLMMLTQGVAETLSIIVRRRNAGALSSATYLAASRALRRELLTAGINLQPAQDALVIASLPLIEQHSINSTDALVLRSALDMAAILRVEGDNLVLVAADRRLLRAAAAEGLDTLDPETASLDWLESLIGAG